MNYYELLSKVPQNLKDVTEFRTSGVKAKGKLALGFGLAATIGDEAKSFGIGKALLVTDKVIVDLGLHKVCTDRLEESGFEVDVYSDVEPEPHIETAQYIQEMVRKNGYTVVVGLGGGSAMDMAKAASLAATNPSDILEYMQGAPINSEGLPLILMPTTSGTGSEVSPYIVTSKGDKKLFISSPSAFATVALVDPLMTVTMPPKVTAATGFDAISHGIEGYQGKPSPLTEMFTAKCIEYVFQYLERACKDGEDLEARYYMAFASVFGMMSYTQGGGLYAHSMSYILTTHNNVGHGLGCGVTLPYTLMFNIEEIKGKLDKFMKLIDPNFNGNQDESAVEFIHRMMKLLKDCGLPTSIQGVGVTEEQLPVIADELINKYYRVKNPRAMDAEEATKFVDSMWAGKPVVI